MKFGPLVKRLRIEKRLTLRSFCQQLKIDPSNWSKIERGINPPPKDSEILSHWADFFKLRGERRQEFLDAAAIARKELPADITNDEALAAQLPAFFRVMRHAEPSEEKLREFIEEVRKVKQADKSE